MVISLGRRDLGALFGPAHPGIVLDVASPARSALAVQVAPPDLLRICQSGSTLISARVDGLSGAHWLRHRPLLSRRSASRWPSSWGPT